MESWMGDMAFLKGFTPPDTCGGQLDHECFPTGRDWSLWVWRHQRQPSKVGDLRDCESICHGVNILKCLNIRKYFKRTIYMDFKNGLMMLTFYLPLSCMRVKLCYYRSQGPHLLKMIRLHFVQLVQRKLRAFSFLSKCDTYLCLPLKHVEMVAWMAIQDFS